MKLLFHADKDLRECGGSGSGPLKWFKAKSKKPIDEFTNASTEPSNPVKELLTRATMLKRGSFHNHSGTFPLIVLLERYKTSRLSRLFKKFGNRVMPHPDKSSFCKFNRMPESELKLSGNILLPEKSRTNKDLREEKRFKSNG